MHKEQAALFGNGRRNNIIVTLDSAESVTCHFRASGSDNATDKYYGLKYPTKKVAIRVNKIATITHIDNKELKSPITLGTTTSNTFKEGIEWNTMVVRAEVDATVFEIYAS